MRGGAGKHRSISKRRASMPDLRAYSLYVVSPKAISVGFCATHCAASSRRRWERAPSSSSMLFCMAAISASWAAARGVPMVTGLGFRLLLRPSDKVGLGFLCFRLPQTACAARRNILRYAGYAGSWAVWQLIHAVQLLV